jgi:hypothetical protein
MFSGFSMRLNWIFATAEINGAEPPHSKRRLGPTLLLMASGAR